MNKITKEQLWYLIAVYPENVTADEASVCFISHCDNIESYEDKEAFIKYWEIVAKFVNKIVNGNVGE
jgi:hypothetical protein